MYNYDMFGKRMKVSDVIEQSYIYFIMALRNEKITFFPPLHYALDKNVSWLHLRLQTRKPSA